MIHQITRAGKSLLAAGCTLSILFASDSYAATALNVSQQPLFLTQGVAPNLLFTLDDSGSMAWAYVPDGISGNSGRAGRSSDYNALYYNPDYAYQVPKKLTLSGDQIIVSDYPVPRFTAAWQDGYAQGSTTNLSNNYRPQWGTGWLGCIDSSCNTGRAYYYTYKVSASCPAQPVSSSNSCYTYNALPTSQESNFAIWYSYYRNRILATKTAANLAFYSLPENVRLTWGALNTCSIGANSRSCQNNALLQFNKQHKINFFNWLANSPASGGTPLHAALDRAGRFLQTNGTAYTTEDGKTYSCRASYHIMMTDGIWNGRNVTPGNLDNQNQTFPDSTLYRPQPPYADSNASSLADLAFKYWTTDLRPSIDNDLKPFMAYKSGDDSKDYWDPRNNPATWQHMVNFTVGLGLSYSLTLNSAPTWTGSTFGNYEELMAGSKAWPSVGNDAAPGNVYDLWHAAINSRGDFFSAESPDSLVQAFNKILTRISERNTSSSKPAMTSALQDDGTGDKLIRYSYQSSFASDKNWAGDLIRYKVESTSTGSTKTQEWSAGALLDNRAPATRNIYIASNSGTNRLKPFTWSNIEGSQLATWLNRNPDKDNQADTKGAQRVDFIRGQQNMDGFRQRQAVLGDIVHSSPAVVGPAQYLTYLANPIEPSGDYGTFKTEADQRSPRVYVGSNDGMLHGFNTKTGVEEFAFIPTAVFEKLNKLTGISYQGGAHQYFVDATPVVSDAFFDGAWHTVLIGTLGAGGRGLFALDVTKPDDVKLLWEYDSSTDSDLGYTFSKPTVARLHSGQWAVVTGNGYGSDNDKAALLLIDLKKGTLIKKLEVQSERGIANGLSTPRLADNNSDGIADYAYAGDLQGNIWRFDLIGNTRNDDPDTNTSINPFKPGDVDPSAFRVSFSGAPLFRARADNNTRQPITAPPTLVRHPSRKGYIVIVGTGKYFEDDDAQADTSRAMTLYGIWDRQTKGESANSTPTIDRNALTAQTMTTEANSTFGSVNRNIRLISQNPVKWYKDGATGTANSDVASYGWRLNLEVNSSKKGEMMIEDMFAAGQVLLLQTLTPNDDPCDSGSTSWTYGLNPYTGGRTSFTVFDLKRAGIVDSGSDYNGSVVSAFQQDGLGGLAITQNEQRQSEACTGDECIIFNPSDKSNGRQTWRVVEEK
ncbi:PilC/PilY family type IV pilus protein [Pseudomonas aeruginosa]|uniref:pilus assembly protein n=1 Tax=Gammaproteobacteria TaxID=1236 RepID=UPI0003B9C0B0|nr:MULTISPECIES: PilC/PilY family type IV pilus protein [Gammaproteobacteria]ESR69944.1 type 4 fimbrial biogenesis protein PilY1 [Pseudomonas aeruginosa VRFPA05]ALZ00929.1 pilus assembly protein PilY [Pseudomonas aeruginosa]ANI08788.1 pilus assembly protein PilY [Pseudomonas aeruginosa SJTD-1]AUA73238.1 pilus assembly protein PilY [Pseudomonas aeruginosa]AUA97859.1 pilus assembly protein PilY [Pseudomonas aeruginosa]